MLNINLINSEKSDVKSTITTFPDGEPHVVLGEINRKESYKVICRITNPNELFILSQVADILNRQGVIWELDIFYLMSMRMDRVINFNESFTLKIVADTINNMHASKVRIYHCHSKRTFEEIKNSVDMETDYDIKLRIPYYGYKSICYPDNGAYNRYSDYDFKYYYNAFIVLKKERDLDDKGKIKTMDIQTEGPLCKDGTSILITDDLCDAGGTFCWAERILREKYTHSKIGIFVRHLVNPIGLKNLSEHFDEVFITNSYKDWKNDIIENKLNNVTVIDIIQDVCIQSAPKPYFPGISGHLNF